MESQTSRMVSVVIVAAGKGTRMGPDVDKLFLEVAGRPVVEHSWRRIDAASVVDEIVIVVRDGMQGAFEELAVELSAAKPYRIVVGGKERQDSVANGIAALNPAAEIVAVHDGARPCVTAELIEATVAAAREGGAAVAAQRVSDTIKESDDGRLISGHPERSRLWAVQTPQTFRVEVIRRALEETRRQNATITDDTAACEFIGQPVRLVESAKPNPKVTAPGDLPLIEALLRAEES
ncbi:MAG: 2-C-methyl-D-erythritol 4-phosphate cytidylyltransferase [Limisphaerales bacterium]|jgi:2-C-methyl-D-erythritol 4-phosphate cytidylyltransferase